MQKQEEAWTSTKKKKDHVDTWLCISCSKMSGDYILPILPAPHTTISFHGRDPSDLSFSSNHTTPCLLARLAEPMEMASLLAFTTTKLFPSMKKEEEL